MGILKNFMSIFSNNKHNDIKVTIKSENNNVRKDNSSNIDASMEKFDDIPSDPKEFEEYMRKKLYPLKEPVIGEYFDLMHEIRNNYSDRDLKSVRKKLIENCIKTVDLIKSNKKVFRDFFDDGIKTVPAIENLISLYCYDREYEKALDVCNFAIDFNIPKNTIGGYEAEKEYLIKCIEKKEKEVINLPPQQVNNLVQNNLFEEWNISISFGKSTSSNYEKALFLAKNAFKYDEVGEGRQITHQAIYTSSESDFNNFVTLYELIKGWKSTFVFINGKYINKKDVSELVRCYGNKCRSGNKRFCYGDSEYTENPFGCHSLMVHTYNSPWWSFGEFDNRGIWHIDKKALRERLEERSSTLPCPLCPVFNMDRVYEELGKLPDTINPKKEKRFERDGNRLLYLVDAGYWR